MTGRRCRGLSCRDATSALLHGTAPPHTPCNRLQIVIFVKDGGVFATRRPSWSLQELSVVEGRLCLLIFSRRVPIRRIFFLCISVFFHEGEVSDLLSHWWRANKLRGIFIRGKRATWLLLCEFGQLVIVCVCVFKRTYSLFPIWQKLRSTRVAFSHV